MSIDALEMEIKDDQNKWLRLQCNIVSMSEKLTQIFNDSHLARQRKICFSNYTEAPKLSAAKIY